MDQNEHDSKAGETHATRGAAAADIDNLTPAEFRDRYRTLAQIRRYIPGMPTTGAIWRWTQYGVSTASGEDVHLRHIRVGRRIYTTVEWLNAFMEELADFNAKPRRRRSGRPPRPMAPPTLSHRRALSSLEEAGL